MGDRKHCERCRGIWYDPWMKIKTTEGQDGALFRGVWEYGIIYHPWRFVGGAL